MSERNSDTLRLKCNHNYTDYRDLKSNNNKKRTRASNFTNTIAMFSKGKHN